MSVKTILIIEDDVILLKQMTVAFTAAGWAATGAEDGDVGLLKFNERPAQVVVTDLIMPTREGIETIMALKAAHPDVRIIAISGGMKIGPTPLLCLARQLGADAALAKPFRHGELVALAESLIEAPAPVLA